MAGQTRLEDSKARLPIGNMESRFVMLFPRYFASGVRRQRPKYLPPCCLLALLALPWAVLVNGRVASVSPITQNGELYVPVSALKAAGAQVSIQGREVHIQFLPYQGGANQMAGVEGPVNTWVHNGLWRTRVLRVEPTVDPYDPQKPGYNVTMEMRNASVKTVSPFLTGVEYPQLFDAGEVALKVDEGAWQTRMQMKEMLQGSGITATIPFYYPHGTATEDVKPAAKFVIPVNTGSGLLRDTGLKYAVKSPAFRIWLTPEKEATP